MTDKEKQAMIDACLAFPENIRGEIEGFMDDGTCSKAFEEYLNTHPEAREAIQNIFNADDFTRFIVTKCMKNPANVNKPDNSSKDG